MAVKKNAQEGAEGEKTAGMDVYATKAENAPIRAQETAQEAGYGAGAEKTAYIGPSLPGGMLQCNRIFDGGREEVRKELADVFGKFPLAEKLLVPVGEMAEKKDKARTAGNALNKHYSDLASITYAAGREE